MNLFRPWQGQEPFDESTLQLTDSSCLFSRHTTNSLLPPPNLDLTAKRNRCDAKALRVTSGSTLAAGETDPFKIPRNALSNDNKQFYSYYYNYYYSQLLCASMQSYCSNLIATCQEVPKTLPNPKSANNESNSLEQQHVRSTDRSHECSRYSSKANESHASCTNARQLASANILPTGGTHRKLSSVVNLQNIITFQNLFLENLNNKKRQTKITDQRPKKFICVECKSAFSNRSQLNSHIRTHTGERPFVCDYRNCQKSFTRNEELTRHRRIHSGIRPFPCRWCDKRFGRKDHLRKHERTHERRLRSTLMLNYTANLASAQLNPTEVSNKLPLSFSNNLLQLANRNPNPASISTKPRILSSTI